MDLRGYTISSDSNELRLQLGDGQSLAAELPEGFVSPLGDSLKRVTIDFDKAVVEMTLHTGEIITGDLSQHTIEQLPPRRRPVVYLDQNHWVELARHLLESKRARPELREACHTLARLANERAIILPLSSGHFAELAARGAWRRDVAVTMLRLAKGWQMRSPIEVRGREIRLALSGQLPVADDVFTLAPNAMYGSPMPDREFASAPAEFRGPMQAVVGLSATVEAVLEDREIGEKQRALKAAAKWAEPHGDLATFMKGAGSTREDTRANSHALILADLRYELATAARDIGMSPEAFTAWLDDRACDDIGALRYVGLLREAIFHRLRNADNIWKAGDLVDMHFLACAVAYADVVIAETDATNYLSRAKSTAPREAKLTADVLQGVEHIETCLR